MTESDVDPGVAHVLLLQVVDVRNKGTLVLDDCKVSCIVSGIGMMRMVREAAGMLGQIALLRHMHAK
jgi:hypothetical protein